MKVVSLFSGIGGLDEGFIKSGYDVIWANDIDKYAAETYRANFNNEFVLGDITKMPIKDIPDFDVLIGGFPCQPFSIMGSELGFEDTRGTLFFRIAEIINYKIKKKRKPDVLVLENVRSLKTHDKGRTFNVIKNVLEKDLKYKFYSDILNSADFGVPQNRRRTYIVCFANDKIEYKFPKILKSNKPKYLQNILEKKVDNKYFLSKKILPTILSNGTGGYNGKSEIDLKIARPLCATMGKMHRACQDNYVTQKGKVRKLTPRECARLQGFDDKFIIPVSDAQAYKQFGNAVTVNVSKEVAKSIKKVLKDNNLWK